MQGAPNSHLPSFPLGLEVSIWPCAGRAEEEPLERQLEWLGGADMGTESWAALAGSSVAERPAAHRVSSTAGSSVGGRS